jgi:hypothetical protein
VLPRFPRRPTLASIAFLAWLTLGPGGLSLVAAGVKGDETVMFCPAVAWPTSNGWQVELKGSIYETGHHPLQTAAVRKMVGLDDEGWTELQRSLFRSRAESFLVDNERGKILEIEIEGKVVRSKKSFPNGHFVAPFTLDVERVRRQGVGPAGGTVNLVGRVAAASGARRDVPIQIHFLANQGWSVISDIDDTIKISNVRDRRALIHTTFCEPFRAVPGMASVYREWSNSGAQFHYVSGSPWQLFPCLDEFLITNRFPAGTFHLKTFRMKDSSVLKMFGPQTRYKSGEISALLKQVPQRRFVLVGDSGEQDPEIYGELARQYRSQIAHILIRNVTREDREASRYRASFRDLPNTLWTVFEDAQTLRDLPLRVR